MTRDDVITCARSWLGTPYRHLIEIPLGDQQPGDVLLFRMGLGHPAKHCGILSSPDRLIHAYWGRAVCETRLVPWWQRRCAAAFQWPDLIEMVARDG